MADRSTAVSPGRLTDRRWLLAGVVLALGLLLAVACYGFLENRRADASRAAVTHTLLVLRHALSFENLAISMEASHRAFLVHGDPQFRDNREKRHQLALAEAGIIRALVSDNPGQVHRVDLALSQLRDRHSDMKRSDAIVATEGIAAARLDFRAFGDGSIEPLRETLQALRDEEDRLLAARNQTSETSSAHANATLLYGTGLAFIVLIAALVALTRQLSATERMGSRLAEARDRLEFTYQASRIGIFELDLDTGVLKGSSLFKQFLGLPATDAAGSFDALLGQVHPDDRGALGAAMDLGAEPGHDWQQECRVLRPDGSLDWIWICGRVRGGGGDAHPAKRMFGVVMDISARKRAEQDLVERSQSLEASNRELEAFSYSVSHDLRAPLRHIDGYARMLVEDLGDSLGPEPLRFLQSISASSRRMGLLIDDLLSLSRLGRKTLERHDVDMDALLAEAWREVRPEGSRTVSLEAARLPPAHGDPALLKQVWVNLLSNAIKYSAPREAQARVTVSAEATAQGTLYSVQDNGVGFDMRYADKLFGVFQRLHAQDKFEGTGVGLAIVQRIVTRHGGRVRAEAEPDRGACFSFELPSPGKTS